MTQPIKAIETVYRGYRFRSRLEARWAVFFDSLGIEFEYEKEGYDLGDAGWYLPDFWLPQHQCWIEIKGQAPNSQEIHKADALHSGTGYPVAIFSGTPDNQEAAYNVRSDIADGSGGHGSDWSLAWSICGGCGRADLTWGDDRRIIVNEINGYSVIPTCFSGWAGERCCDKQRAPKGSHQRVRNAIDAARSARFERSR